ncbi:MAG TPA: FG-GAP-like repeat-containing protein [Blastocatellia bacterium]|nr:FG-GAP-like repeat-containing protein [Blastocatellia bacterium]
MFRNEYGAVIKDASGQQFNYTRQQLQAQARATTPQAPSPDAPLVSGAEPVWSYAIFGSGIGISNIVTADNGGQMEIYAGGSSATFGGNAYWYALRYNAVSKGYEQIYVSPYYAPGIRRIKVANVVGDAAKEIVVALQNGQVLFYNVADKRLVGQITTAATDLYAMDIADIDNDGTAELILATTTHLYVYSAAGALKWDLPQVGGYDLVVAQMDADSALEIALTDGHIVDGATHTVQWTWQYGFGRLLRAADIDGDGMSELLVAEGWQYLWAYDVDRQLPKWSISTSQDIGAIYVGDVDGDSVQDLLVGQGQWGNIIAFNTMTQQQEWFVQNPEHGVTNIAIADVDGDGKTELLWGAGATSTGPDYLYVVDWQTKVFEWQNVDLVGPFVGPEVGDLDGDGHNELVVLSTGSNSGYNGGRLLVFDAETRRLRAISDANIGSSGWGGWRDIKLRDVDNDGRMEIMTASDSLIQIYDFDSSNNFTLNWSNSAYPSGGFTSIDAADIDNDGVVEIVGGTNGYVYVYSYATRLEEWHSLYMRGPVTGLGLADVDRDGVLEVVGQVSAGDVYIFSGTTKELEALLPGPFTSMHIQTMKAQPSIILGNSSGNIIIKRFAAGTYPEVYNKALVTSAIDDFTVDAQNRVWVSSAGVLNLFSLAGVNLWQNSGFGTVFGKHVAFLRGVPVFFTTGSFSVVAFSLATVNKTDFDFDADLKTDLAVWRPSTGVWFSLNSSSATSIVGWGVSGDKIVPGDYDGDGRVDIAVYRPSTGVWYIVNSSDSSVRIVGWGTNEDVPVPADYDGDRKTDVAVWRPSTGTWYILNSATGSISVASWGVSTDKPVRGDFDGDGRADIAVYRPSTGVWYVINSLDGTISTTGWGTATDVAVPADYDGDGYTDIAVWRPSNATWYILNSATGLMTSRVYGSPGNLPVPADYDGDGKADLAVFNSSTGLWSIRNSSDAGLRNQFWGATGDDLVPAAFIR